LTGGDKGEGEEITITPTLTLPRQGGGIIEYPAARQGITSLTPTKLQVLAQIYEFIMPFVNVKTAIFMRLPIISHTSLGVMHTQCRVEEHMLCYHVS